MNRGNKTFILYRSLNPNIQLTNCKRRADPSVANFLRGGREAAWVGLEIVPFFEPGVGSERCPDWHAYACRGRGQGG